MQAHTLWWEGRSRTYPGDGRQRLHQGGAVEVGFLRRVLHVDDVEELQRVHDRVTAGGRGKIP